MGLCRALAGSGLHGRKPVFATPRALAASYLDTYVDLTGRIKAFALVDLRVMGTYDWRLADRNVWKVERMLLETKHQPLRMPEARFRDFRRRYRAFKEQYPDQKPLFYEGKDKWTSIPTQFLSPPRRSVKARNAGMMSLWRRKIRRDSNLSAKSSVRAATPCWSST